MLEALWRLLSLFSECRRLGYADTEEEVPAWFLQETPSTRLVPPLLPLFEKPPPRPITMDEVHDIEMAEADRPVPVPSPPTKKRTRRGAAKKTTSKKPMPAAAPPALPVAPSREPKVPENEWSCYIARNFTRGGAPLPTPHFAMVYAKDASTAAAMMSGAAKSRGLDAGGFHTRFYMEQSGAWAPEQRRGTDINGKVEEFAPTEARLAFYSARVTPGAGVAHRHGPVPVVFAMAHDDKAAVKYMNSLVRDQLDMPRGVGKEVDRAPRQYGVVQFYPSDTASA